MKDINNNILALLLLATMGIHLTLSFLYLEETDYLVSTTGKVTGQVGVCTSYPPIIDAISSHTVAEGAEFYLRVTGVNRNSGGNLSFFTNETATFNISMAGTVNTTFDDPMVGLHTPKMTAKEDFCNNSNSTLFNLNITNVNEAPIIEDIPNLTAWEDAIFYSMINYSDPDNNTPEGEELMFLDNTELFDVNSTGEIQFIPVYNETGNYSITIFLTDFEYSDFKIFSLWIREINDAPVIATIGAQTAIAGSVFYLKVNATDEEGDNLTYSDNVTLFNINSTGEIKFTPTYAQLGTHSINITVSDGQRYVSEVFSLSVVTYDQAPNITYKYPSTSPFTVYERSCQNFTVVATDPDNTAPSITWYVNNTIVGNNDTYFFCQAKGTYNLTVVASDGYLYDSFNWTVIVLELPPGVTSGVGTVSYPPQKCTENWRCGNWSTCSRAGIQLRACTDLMNCGTYKLKPPENMSCTYSPLPSCEDGVASCHDGQCEVLIDCGGPCLPCSTCSDNTKNQGEEGVDCGGPCPPCKVPCALEELFALNPDTGECKSFVTKCDIPRGWSIVKGCPQRPPPAAPEGVPLIWLVALAVLAVIGSSGFITYRKTGTIFMLKPARKTEEVSPSLIYAREAIGKINGIYSRVNKADTAGLFKEFYKAMREFFSRYLVISTEFTLQELQEELSKKEMKYSKGIVEFFNILYRMGYSPKDISVQELEQAIYQGTHIIQAITGYRPVKKPVEKVPLAEKARRKLFRTEYTEIKWEMLKRKYGAS